MKKKSIIALSLLFAVLLCACLEDDAISQEPSDIRSSISQTSSILQSMVSSTSQQQEEKVELISQTDAYDEYLLTVGVVSLTGVYGSLAKSDGYCQYVIRLPLELEIPQPYFILRQGKDSHGELRYMADIVGCLKLESGQDFEDFFENIDLSDHTQVYKGSYEGPLGNMIYYDITSSILFEGDQTYVYSFLVELEKGVAAAIFFYTIEADYTVDEPYFRSIVETIRKA